MRDDDGGVQLAAADEVQQVVPVLLRGAGRIAARPDVSMQGRSGLKRGLQAPAAVSIHRTAAGATLEAVDYR